MTCNTYQARENLQPAPNAEKRGKTFNRLHVTSAKRGKRTGTKRGKTCRWCLARENTDVTSAKRGKTCNRSVNLKEKYTFAN